MNYCIVNFNIIVSKKNCTSLYVSFKLLHFVFLVGKTFGGGRVKWQIFGEKKTQIHLIIIREGPKNTLPHPPILRNLNYFAPWCIIQPPPPTIRHKRVSQEVAGRT